MGTHLPSAVLAIARRKAALITAWSRQVGAVRSKSSTKKTMLSSLDLVPNRSFPMERLTPDRRSVTSRANTLTSLLDFFSHLEAIGPAHDPRILRSALHPGALVPETGAVQPVGRLRDGRLPLVGIPHGELQLPFEVGPSPLQPGICRVPVQGGVVRPDRFRQRGHVNGVPGGKRRPETHEDLSPRGVFGGLAEGLVLDRRFFSRHHVAKGQLPESGETRDPGPVHLPLPVRSAFGGKHPAGVLVGGPLVGRIRQWLIRRRRERHGNPVRRDFSGFGGRNDQIFRGRGRRGRGWLRGGRRRNGASVHASAAAGKQDQRHREGENPDRVRQGAAGRAGVLPSGCLAADRTRRESPPDALPTSASPPWAWYDMTPESTRIPRDK